MQFQVKEAELGLGVECGKILRRLPDWFGIESALEAYIRRIDSLPTFVAAVEGNPAGFLTIEKHFPSSAEIHVMGVLPELHGKGIGKALLQRAEKWLLENSVDFLQVKTLSPSRVNSAYAETRAFYGAMGFVPLEEMPSLWGTDNPCLIMVKYLRA